MGYGLGLDPWFDEPAYEAAMATFSERGTFILGKLLEHDRRQAEGRASRPVP